MPVINTDPNKGAGGVMGTTGRAYGIAVEFVVYIGVCAGLGWLVDRYVIGGGQTGLIVGGAFGLVGATIRIVRAMGRLANTPSKPVVPPGDRVDRPR